METAAEKGKSRRRKEEDQKRRDGKLSHFQTVRFGGFEENQMICYLWDMTKAVEAARSDAGHGTETMAELEKKMRHRVRVEMRRYFLRHKRRSAYLLIGGMMIAVSAIILFGCVIGVDRVSGISMYPYLNHGDWIVYSRVGPEIKRDDVVVFEKQGESLVKRITGLPGDTVEINASGSRVVVNGIPVSETYVILPDGNSVAEMEEMMGVPQTVMDGQYLVLGDNRKVSIDSRDRNIGTVSRDEILGRVILILRTRG